MSENSRRISVTVVIPHDVRLSIAEIQEKPLMLSACLTSTSRQSIRKHFGYQIGSLKPLTMQVEGSFPPFSIEKIMRRPLSQCGWTTGSSSTKPTKDAEQQRNTL